MLIDSLLNILPPPPNPDVTPTLATWNNAFRFLQTRLPEDYVQFINHYGTGDINDFLYIHSPFSAREHLNLLQEFAPTLSCFSGLKSDFPELYPYPLYFEPGGLIPFGHTDRGDTFFWLTTTSTIDDWPLVIVQCARNGDFHARYDLPLTQFLLDTFAGKLRCPLLPEDWSHHPPTFKPR